MLCADQFELSDLVTPLQVLIFSNSFSLHHISLPSFDHYLYQPSFKEAFREKAFYLFQF